MPEEIPAGRGRHRHSRHRRPGRRPRRTGCRTLLAAAGATLLAGTGTFALATERPDPTPDPVVAAVDDPDGGPPATRPEDLPAEVPPEALADADDTTVVDGDDIADQGGGSGGGGESARIRGLEPAIAFALGHLGDPYGYGGAGPHRWDCSGLVQEAYRRAGVRLPRLAADQYRATRRIPRSALSRGDLVFWSSDGRASGVHHVAIYLGGGRYVEAARPGTRVRISSLAYFDARMYGRIESPDRDGLRWDEESGSPVTCTGDEERCDRR
ncbi:C40 family peptidase [Streptomyces abikoensis]|uniref:C40 family peptidase n=1 Tax=Streptomyces abikoensis TaxID=97398 RepID=UPI00371648BA